MIDIKELLANKEAFLRSFSAKGYDLVDELEETIKNYNNYLKILQEEENLRSKINQFNKEFKKTSNLIEVKKKAINYSEKIKKLKEKRIALSTKIHQVLLTFPNIVASSVPIGKDQNDNKILSYHLHDSKRQPKSFAKAKKPHWELLREKELLLDDAAIYLSGRRNIVLTGKAVLILDALRNFMLQEHRKNAYQIYELPLLANRQSLENAGQLPKFEDELFRLNNQQYLIPTAEVPLINLFAKKQFLFETLPLKATAFSNCFRNEKVAAGKESRGIVRLFQFRKVELVKIGKPEDSENDFSEIAKTAMNILDKLKLPYRVVELCSGDLSFSSQKTLDLEVWMPGLGNYLELSSISMIGDFQTRRMQTKYLQEDGKKAFPYTYNASGLALERTFAAILENYQQEDGQVIVPKVLQKFVNFTKF